MTWKVRLRLLTAVSFSLVTAIPVAATTLLVPGFEETIHVSNFNGIAQFDFAPDGTIFMGSKSGYVRYWDGTGPTSHTQIIRLDSHNSAERGINGIAVDPDFLTNQRVWIYYTHDDPGTGVIANRLTHFTWNGSALINETVVVQFPPSISDFHNAGGLKFAADKSIFLATGDDRQGSATAQDPHSLFGKILHLNRDGTPGADNPWPDGVGGHPLVWAIGFRNPYRISIQPDTGNVFIGDVGFAKWEEINIGIPGGNFGWGEIEGPLPAGVPGYVYPIHSYFHNGVNAAIIAGDFAEPGDFSEEYEGDYFYVDYPLRELRRLQLDETNSPVQETLFANDLATIPDMKFGPGGSFYYVARNGQDGSTGEIRKITYVGGSNRQPTAVAQITPSSGPAPLSTTLDATGSSDPDDDTLVFDWDLGDGTGSTDGVVNKVYPLGVYHVELTVDDGQGSQASTPPIKIVSGNNAPTVTIDSPVDQASFFAGQSFNFSATTGDTEDTTVPCDRHRWQVILHHADHTHPFLGPLEGVCGGSFTTGTRIETDPDIYYEIRLTVEDSGDPLGEEASLTTTAEIAILPTLVDFTLATAPRPDLQLRLDTLPTAPDTFTGVVGTIRGLGVVDDQLMPDGHTYRWLNWSSGEAMTHEISSPATPTTYTATFGCDVLVEIDDLTMTYDSIEDEIRVAWTSSADSCLAEYRVYGGTNVVPSGGSGEFPIDPAWTLEAVTSAANFVRIPADTGATIEYFLVLGQGTDGVEGPLGHYGR